MQRQELGTSGISVSKIGLGTFNTVRSPEELGSVVNEAITLGINFIDTAESYANGAVEKALGSILGSRRKEVVLATKWGGGAKARQPGAKSGSRDYIVTALEASLRRLKTDYIDLYQYHHVDPETPIEETVAVLDGLIRQGKLRAWGVSNMSSRQVIDTLRACRKEKQAEFVSCQSHYSLLRRKAEVSLLPRLRKEGKQLLAYFPLERGLLTGKYKRGIPLPEGTRLGRAPNSATVAKLLSTENFEIVEQLTKLSIKYERTLAELALAWLLSEPAVACAIVGATSARQVAQNAKAASRALTDVERKSVSELTTPH